MTTLKAPVLPDEFVISNHFPEISIDKQVISIIEKSVISPVLKSCPAETLREIISSELPDTGTPIENLLEELESSVLKYRRNNAHPGCWAYISSSGLPTDPLGHALTAALNQNVTGFHSAPAASIIEQTVIDWIIQLADMPDGAGGILVGGGSLANLSALTVARDSALGSDSIEKGIHGGLKPVLLAAETAHFSVIRAARILGIGKKNIIPIKVNDKQQINIDSLAELLDSLSADKGIKIVAVVASAGTTACGAIDPLNDIADLCKRYGVWLHIDAAYGGAALLSDKLRKRLVGIGRADSITIDLHKWCYMSLDCSVLLYRDPELARKIFSIQADYVPGHISKTNPNNFFDLSPEASRRFRALSIWLAFRYYGTGTLGRNILYNVECAEYLAHLVNETPELELLGEPQLSICCFRYVPQGRKLTEEQVDDLNNEIIQRLADKGDFLLSPTNLHGRSVLRVCIRSHTTRVVHIESLVRDICKLGKMYG